MKHQFAYPKNMGYIHNLGDFAIVYDFSSDQAPPDYEPYPSFAEVLTTVSGVIVCERVSLYNKQYTISPHPSLAQIKWAIQNHYIFEKVDQAVAENGKLSGHTYPDGDKFYFSRCMGSTLPQDLLLQLKGTYDAQSIVYTFIAKFLYWLYGDGEYKELEKWYISPDEAKTYTIKEEQ